MSLNVVVAGLVHDLLEHVVQPVLLGLVIRSAHVDLVPGI